MCYFLTEKPTKCTCGLSSISSGGNRITDGQDTKEGEIPWQAKLVYKGHHTCGGSLLNSDTVLTAAHCLLETNPQNPDGKLIKIQIDKLTVILGTIYNISSEKEENRQTSQVKNEISHPAYNEKTFDNDFAILKLATPVKFTKYVNPIRLPESSNLNLDSVEAMVSGWGVNYGLDVTSFPAILQKVKRNTGR